MDKKSTRRIFWYNHKISERLLFKNATTPRAWFIALLKSFQIQEPTTQTDYFAWYLTSTKEFCIRFLTVNIALLLLSIYVIAQKHFGYAHFELDPTFDAFQPAIVEITVWMLFAVLCLVFFLVLHYKPSVFQDLLMEDPYNIWCEIGAAILCSRFLILVTQLVTVINTGEKCLDASDLSGTGDTTFGYMFIKMTVDAFQTYTFAALPFPQPWAVVFVTVEMIRQEIRVFSCADRITTDPELRWIIYLIAYLIVNTYIMLIIIPSIYLEGSYRNRYKRLQMQRQAEESKQEMVTFLCTDVRVPLQYMLHALDSIDWVSLSGNDVHPLLADIHKYSHVVNDIADDLLLLVRIKENRYTSKMMLVPNLQQLFDNIVQSVLERRKRHAAPVDAEAPNQECFVYATTPTIAATVNQECLVAALRHLLIFITHHKQEGASAAGAGATQPGPPSVQVEVTAKIIGSKRLVITITSNSLHQRGWSEERKVHEATNFYVCSAIAVSCNGTFRGDNFKYELTLPCAPALPAELEDVVETGDAVSAAEEHKTVENKEAENKEAALAGPPADNDAESVANSLATNLRSMDTINRKVDPIKLQSDNEQLEAKIKLSADMQARFKKNRVCVIIEDTVLEDVITGAIKRMHLDEGMAVLHELQRGTMPIAKLTFVTSFRLCQELRARRYQGLIVLFSGSMSYLDDAQLSMLDYCLQLPCTDLHLSAFIDWLVTLHDEESKLTAATPPTTAPAGARPLRLPPSHASSTRGSLRQRRMDRVNDIPTAPPMSLLSRMDATVDEAVQIGPVLFIFVIYKLVRGCHITWSAEWSKNTWFLVPALPQGTFESYTKWKLLNPAGSWYHHSTELFFTIFTRLIFGMIVDNLLVPKNIFGALVANLGLVVVLSRGCIYRFILKPCNIPLYAYWLIPPLLVAGYYTYAVLANGIAGAPEDRNMSLRSFADYKFAGDGRDGTELIFSQIMSGCNARLYSIYWPQPLNVTVFVLMLLRASQGIWQALRMLCSVQICIFLQLVFIQMTTMNIQYTIHLETSYRNEFMVAHQHILDKAFLDQCLDICQQDIRKPLELLLARQDDLVKVIMRSAYVRSVHLTRALVCKLEPLHVSTLLFTEMVNAFAYQNQAVMADNVVLPRSPMELVQLNRVVAKIIAGFSSYAENFHIKITSEIDNKLAVIRVDWQMLSMILTNLLNTALKNVRDYCIEMPRNKDLMNHILLKFTAIDSDAKLPFVHPRLMLTNVCDSSNMAAKSAAKSVNKTTLGERQDMMISTGAASAADLAEQSDRVSSKYAQSVCEKLVRKVSLKPLFETVATDSQFQTVQRFTFNYHLTPQTRKAQEFIEAEADKDFLAVMVCPSNYHSAYERTVQPVVPAAATKSGPPPRMANAKRMVYLSGVEPEQRKETIKLTKRFDSHGWSCAVKYILKVPSMYTIDNADCVLIDQQLELLHNVNISDTVLKLRVCGFNGLIAVLLQEGARLTDVIKEELSRSAADVDLLMYAPLKDQNIQALTVALERKYIKQLLYMNGN